MPGRSPYIPPLGEGLSAAARVGGGGRRVEADSRQCVCGGRRRQEKAPIPQRRGGEGVGGQKKAACLAQALLLGRRGRRQSCLLQEGATLPTWAKGRGAGGGLGKTPPTHLAHFKCRRGARRRRSSARPRETKRAEGRRRRRRRGRTKRGGQATSRKGSRGGRDGTGEAAGLTVGPARPGGGTAFAFALVVRQAGSAAQASPGWLLRPWRPPCCDPSWRRHQHPRPAAVRRGSAALPIHRWQRSRAGRSRARAANQGEAERKRLAYVRRTGVAGPRPHGGARGAATSLLLLLQLQPEPERGPPGGCLLACLQGRAARTGREGAVSRRPAQ